MGLTVGTRKFSKKLDEIQELGTKKEKEHENDSSEDELLDYDKTDTIQWCNQKAQKIPRISILSSKTRSQTPFKPS